jgi:tetratricopeptide (TPR) repeat protein
MQRMIAKYFEKQTVERLARSEQALERALELNPDLSAAENVLAHLEVDLGRAEESMVRLLRRAKDRPADPDLYAGLTHACRYCGLLSAAIAANEQARRIDPRLRTSGAHNYFMLGDYERVLDFQPEGIPYMRNLALLMMGKKDEALDSLNSITISGENRLSHYVAALRYTILGDREAAAAELRRLFDIPDPEARFYIARGLAVIDKQEEALAQLRLAVDGGFFCLPTFARDPWLDSLRGTHEFTAIVHRAEARHRQAVIAFLTAEGNRLLGVTHPV